MDQGGSGGPTIASKAAIQQLEEQLTALRDETLGQLALLQTDQPGARERVADAVHDISTGPGVRGSGVAQWESPEAELRKAAGLGGIVAGVGMIAGPLGLALGTIAGSALTGVVQLMQRRARAKKVRNEVIKLVAEAHALQVDAMRHWTAEVQRDVTTRVQATAAAYERVLRAGD